MGQRERRDSDPADRVTASLDGEFVVLLIGMRINAPLKVYRWFPVVRAMGRMLAELRRHPDFGLLGGEMWFGRTTISVQYWRSMAALHAFATGREATHLPAWQWFNRALAGTRDVGVWHEAYVATPGGYENIYVDMPPFGLGRVGRRVPATGPLGSARGRLEAGGPRTPGGR